MHISECHFCIFSLADFAFCNLPPVAAAGDTGDGNAPEQVTVIVTALRRHVIFASQQRSLGGEELLSTLTLGGQPPLGRQFQDSAANRCNLFGSITRAESNLVGRTRRMDTRYQRATEDQVHSFTPLQNRRYYHPTPAVFLHHFHSRIPLHRSGQLALSVSRCFSHSTGISLSDYTAQVWQRSTWP